MNLNVTQNKLTIPVDEFFSMAARINKKRGFLFVSKMLGKHIPVDPYKPLLASGLLAASYYESVTDTPLDHIKSVADGFLSDERSELSRAYDLLKSKPLELQEAPIVIGFAETATALGQAVFDCFDQAYYIHTTREAVDQLTPEFNFKEEHSHAVDQRCYADESILRRNHPILLVDDEITTGKTCLNIIKELHAKYPRNHYSVLSLLDWRLEEHLNQYTALEKELGITITVHSLLKGTIAFNGKPLEVPLTEYHSSKSNHRSEVVVVKQHDFSAYFDRLPGSNYLTGSGRFGIDDSIKEKIEESCQNASNQLNREVLNGETLCLGTGEFMYIPMKIASYLQGDVYYHSTTRSPVQPLDSEGYAIRSGFTFRNPEDQEVQHYVYNIPVGKYDSAIIMFEKEVSEDEAEELISILAEREIYRVHLVSCS